MIRRKKLDNPHSKCAFDRITINGGYRVGVSLSGAIAKRSKPVHLRVSSYISRLRGIDRAFVILYDLDYHRAWLIDGTNTLLHLLRASLLQDQTSRFPHDSECHIDKRIKESEQVRSSNTAAAVLKDDENLNIPLYKDPDDIEEYEETSTEAVEASEVTSKQTIKRFTEKTQTWYRLKDRIEEICSFLEHIVDHQSDTESEDGVGFKIRVSPRKQLEGLHFAEIASTKSPLQPRVITLHREGKGWVDFTRSINAITLFGTGFGELLRPSPETRLCSPWATVPTALNYVVVPTSVLKVILGEYVEDDGCSTRRSIELVNKIYWHTPDKLFDACACTNGSVTHSDRAQVLTPSTWLHKLQTRALKLKQPTTAHELGDNGAVIFGKSRQLPLVWGDHGEPEEERQDSGGDSTQDQLAATQPTSVSLAPGTAASQTLSTRMTAVSRTRKASLVLTGATKKFRH